MVAGRQKKWGSFRPEHKKRGERRGGGKKVKTEKPDSKEKKFESRCDHSKGKTEHRKKV